MIPLQKRIEDALLRNPQHADYQIAKNLRCLTATVRQVRLKQPTSETDPETNAKGFSLRGARVFARRPVESAAKFIKRLPAGRGFDPKELSKEWGMSEETIRKHARDLGCLRYVEVSDDEWLPLVLNPETAKQYPA